VSAGPQTQSPRLPGSLPVAGWDDLKVLSLVIAEAFHGLAPSRWLISDPGERRAIFPPMFQIYVELALASGFVLTNPDRTAAAVWLHVRDGHDDASLDHDERLAAATGPHIERFRLFDRHLQERHPTGVDHYHLAMLAVHPGVQRRGIGSALLSAAHETLDQAGIPAYLEASDTGTRSLYLRHGYADRGEPIQLPDGPQMYPMWRLPVS